MESEVHNILVKCLYKKIVDRIKSCQTCEIYNKSLADKITHKLEFLPIEEHGWNRFPKFTKMLYIVFVDYCNNYFDVIIFNSQTYRVCICNIKANFDQKLFPEKSFQITVNNSSSRKSLFFKGSTLCVHYIASTENSMHTVMHCKFLMHLALNTMLFSW